MRLVDADAMKLLNTDDVGFCLWLDHQPTAFDVEKVQKELTDKMNNCAIKGDDGAGRAYDDACVIVKHGYMQKG